MPSHCKSRLAMLPVLLGLIFLSTGRAQTVIPSVLSEESETCITCHVQETHAIYEEWGTSRHFRANVGCYECHQAKKSDADLFDHEGYNISIIVSPKDCARCHPQEVREFDDSRHSKAGLILGSLDNFLADIVAGDKNFYGVAPTLRGCDRWHSRGNAT